MEGCSLALIAIMKIFNPIVKEKVGTPMHLMKEQRKAMLEKSGFFGLKHGE